MKNRVVLILFIFLFFGCDGGYSGNEDEMSTSISSDSFGDDDTTNCPSSGCMFVVVGESGIGLTSTDGISWTTSNSGIGNAKNDVGFGENMFIAVGPGSVNLHYTFNGNNWNYGSVPTGQTLNELIYGKDRFVSVGDSGTIITSPDGLTWTLRLSLIHI